MIVKLALAPLVAGLVAGAIAGCHTPGDLQLAAPPQRLIADHRVITTTTGATTLVSATLRDASGNVVPVTNARWDSFDSTVAVVVPDTAAIPGSYVARATIVGRTRTGGWTIVIVTAAGLSDTVRVTVLPTKLDASLIAFAGTPHPDTVVRAAQFGPPPEPAVATTFSAPDTLVINGTAVLHFDTTSSSGFYGPAYVRTAAGRAAGYVVSKTPTQLRLVFVVAAAGPLVVQHLLLATADSSVGTLRIDSLVGDSVAVSRQRFTGSVTVIGDTLTAAPRAGTAFSTSSCGYPSTSCVTSSPASLTLDTATAAAMSLTAAQIRVLSPVSYSGPVTVRNLVVPRSDGSAFAFDSLKTNGSYTIAAATFPGTITTGGRLLDTVTVRATGNAKLVVYGPSVPAVYDCGGCRYGTYILSYTSDSVRFIAPVAVDGPILIGSVTVEGATLPMYTRAPLVVSGTTTGEANEPANDSAAGATMLPGQPAFTVIGALNGATDTSDYYTFTLTSVRNVAVVLEFPGNGLGDSLNPDLAVVMCNSLSAGVCGPANDLLKGAGSTRNVPRYAYTTAVPAGQLWLRVIARSATHGSVAYRLTVS